MPLGVSSGCIIAPAKAAGPPASAMIRCEVRCRIASSPPGRRGGRNPLSLHIVPDGRKTAASKPSRSATRSHSAVTCGSSKRCSSPTSASAMALRMAEEGRVCVSEYRFTRAMKPVNLLQAVLRVLLELHERGARRAVRVHEPGVPRPRLTEPAVDVHAGELGLVAL